MKRLAEFVGWQLQKMPVPGDGRFHRSYRWGCALWNWGRR